MASLAGAGIEENRGAAGAALTDVWTTIRAATIVAAIDRDAGGDAIDPAQAALWIAVGLHTSGGFAIQCAGQCAVGTLEGVLGSGLLQHRGVEAAVDEKFAIAAQPGGGGGDLGDNALAQ